MILTSLTSNTFPALGTFAGKAVDQIDTSTAMLAWFSNTIIDILKKITSINIWTQKTTTIWKATIEIKSLQSAVHLILLEEQIKGQTHNYLNIFHF